MKSPDTRPVVVGIDGAPGSAGALRYGVAEARRRGAPLRLVHVVHPTRLVPAFPPVGPAMPVAVRDPRVLAESILRQAADVVHQLAPGLEVSSELRHGAPAASIVDATKNAQLLVIGRETRRGLDRLLTGATTAAVASHAECVVVVVPSFWTALRPHDQVVAAIKSRDHAHQLLAQAFAEARARSATLTVVKAWELPDPYLDRIEVRTHSADWEADGEEMLGELLSEWRTAYPDVSVVTRVAHGPAADVVLSTSQDADLLLISRRRHGFPPQRHLGGVAHAVLRRSDVPVVVVPFVVTPDEPTPELVLEESGVPLK